MENKIKVIIAVVSLVTAFAFGRWAAPDKVKIETRTVEVERKDSTLQKEQDRNRRKETTKTEVTKPDGTVEKTEKTVETADTHAETDKRDTATTEISKQETKEVTRGTAKVTVAAMVGVDLSPGQRPPVWYGGTISKPILGPITVGVWYLTAPAAGATIGLAF